MTLRSSRGGKLVRLVSAGQVDAGFAALAGFAVGLFAARYLDVATLGAYALFQMAWLAAAEIPAQFVFSPATIEMAAHDRERRPAMLRWSLPRGWLASVSGLPFLLVALLVVGRDIDPFAAKVFAVGSLVLLFVSPTQDHIRAVLHLGGRSWAAAMVSVIQASVALVTLVAARNSPVVAPMLALVLANVTSSAFGVFVSRSAPRGASVPSWRSLIQIGRWLAFISIANSVAALVSASLVESLVGTAELGIVEAARIAARPFQVIGVGILAVLGPRLLESAIRRSLRQADRIRRAYIWILFGLAIPFTAVAAFPWEWNPFYVLLPNAFAVDGLVLVWLVSIIAGSLQATSRVELMGAQSFRPLIVGEIIGDVLQIAIAATAVALGGIVMPLGIAVASLVRWVVFRKPRAAIYSGGSRG
jgi:O-antigen/teichoic acid export membrane protein